MGVLVPSCCDLRASSIIPEISFGGIVVLDVCFFLLCGFIEGDCLTAREGFFKAAEEVFLLDFRMEPGLEAEIGAPKSRFISMGEVVSEVSELRTAPYTER